ncbi:MAG: hypothetical protein M3276_10825 [Actinomycetota bacterium]|nr:hypothetical protein [Actinomycetota bacterium]
MSRFWGDVGKGRRLLIIVVVGGLLGACGSGATEGPGDGDELSAPNDGDPTFAGGGNGGGGDGGGGDEGGGAGGEEYGWGLPQGPYTPDGVFEDEVYVPLQGGSCELGQSELETFWDQLRSPRGVLLYQAAVDSCRGDREAARRRFEQAGAYGWQGVDWVASGGFRYDCEVYKSLRSVLEQRARDRVTCPGGDPPGWPSADPGVPRDDPRTPENESEVSEPPSSEPPASEPPASEPPASQPPTSEAGISESPTEG